MSSPNPPIPFSFVLVNKLEAETGEGNLVSPSWLCQAFLGVWFGGAACPWAVSWQSGSSIMGSAGPVCWSLAAGSYTHSGMTAPASLELSFSRCYSWKIMPEAYWEGPNSSAGGGELTPCLQKSWICPTHDSRGQKVPDLERYVGGCICLLVSQPVSTNKRVRHAETDTHINVHHLYSSDFTKAVSLNMTLSY